jgi:hypothetical protein
MAGSNRFFVYVDDIGDSWAILRDEGSTELVNGTAADIVPATNAPILMGKSPIEPRYINYNSSDGLHRRKVVLLANTTTALSNAPAVVTFDTETGPVEMQRTSYVGERRRFVPQTDTRQLDGDTETSGAGP